MKFEPKDQGFIADMNDYAKRSRAEDDENTRIVSRVGEILNEALSSNHNDMTAAALWLANKVAQLEGK